MLEVGLVASAGFGDGDGEMMQVFTDVGGGAGCQSRFWMAIGFGGICLFCFVVIAGSS